MTMETKISKTNRCNKNLADPGGGEGNLACLNVTNKSAKKQNTKYPKKMLLLLRRLGYCFLTVHLSQITEIDARHISKENLVVST